MSLLNIPTSSWACKQYIQRNSKKDLNPTDNYIYKYNDMSLYERSDVFILEIRLGKVMTL